MGLIKKICSYIGHYGIRSFFSLAYEKRVTDRRRFAIGERAMPEFPEYRKREEKLSGGHCPESVLFLVHYFYPDRSGGTERFTLNMARAMQAEGKRVLVAVLDFNQPRIAYTESLGGILYRRYEYEGVKCIGFRHKRAPLGLYYKRIDDSDPDMRAFARMLIEECGAELLHATYPQPFVPFLSEARALGIPYLLTLTDFSIFCHYATMVRGNGELCSGSQGGEACAKCCYCSLAGDTKARYLKARELLASAIDITVPSEFSARAHAKEFPEVKFRVIPHGISTSFSYKKREGAPKSFLYAGGIARHKGIELLLRAFSSLEGEDLRLTVAGVGDTLYERRLKRKYKDSRIEFIGAVTQGCMPELYADADCVVVPSLFYESYSFVAREALATGALVVAANIGALTEAVTDGENGILFTPGSVESLRDALRRAKSFDLSKIKEVPAPTVDDEAKGVYRPFTRS